MTTEDSWGRGESSFTHKERKTKRGGYATQFKSYERTREGESKALREQENKGAREDVISGEGEGKCDRVGGGESAMRAAATAHPGCMSAAAWSFVIDQGADFYREIRLTESTGSPVDLTGYSVRAQVRETAESSTVLAEWTIENGRFSIPSPGSGVMVLSIPAGVTSTYSWPNGGVFDIELVSPAGGVERLLMGAITISPEVTR